MLKRLKAAILALLGEPAKVEKKRKKRSDGLVQLSTSPIGVDCSSGGEESGFDHGTWHRLSNLFHMYQSINEIGDAKSMVDRMRRMAIGHIEDKERAEHRDEIASAANPGQPGQGNHGRL
ncbi:hypothetical protein [Massilia sp. NP310]|uniref:hypothetical protein n=1 Tax=Massilia sp. NP310 TaxID=2861282 RepID=UPI001C62AD86|nr:hypothetical protein [Massilia sp. NP310]QYG04043.1 hypothetical protein KY496_11995 [Massilia sp. NP310]